MSVIDFAEVPAAVQVESLHCFSFLCSQLNDRLPFELLAEFPSLLLPLTSDNQVSPVFKIFKCWLVLGAHDGLLFLFSSSLCLNM